MSVVRIKEGRIIEVFLKKIYENSVGTSERWPYYRGVRTEKNTKIRAW